MVEILEEAMLKVRKKKGRKRKLSVREQLMMTLEYLREYRTYFHIGNSYGISESSGDIYIKVVLLEKDVLNSCACAF
jgi:DNA-directed RNA polymerase specialized sigma subunit